MLVKLTEKTTSQDLEKAEKNQLIQMVLSLSAQNRLLEAKIKTLEGRPLLRRCFMIK
jgi:hypothetical protein